MTVRLPLTPYAVLDGFLSAEERARLWAWTLDHQDRFVPSTIGDGVLDSRRRVSGTVMTKKFDDWPAFFRARVDQRLDEILALTGTKPFAIDSYEISLVAHGDGAHFTRHSDIEVGPGRRPTGGDGTGQDRLLSAVYYFHREPKGFSGGELRLHRFGSEGAPGDYADVEPLDNRLLVFPSWVPHEVRPVAVPSGQFEDQRFAVNVWLCTRLAR